MCKTPGAKLNSIHKELNIGKKNLHAYVEIEYSVAIEMVELPQFL